MRIKVNMRYFLNLIIQFFEGHDPPKHLSSHPPYTPYIPMNIDRICLYFNDDNIEKPSIQIRGFFIDTTKIGSSRVSVKPLAYYVGRPAPIFINDENIGGQR